MSDAGIATRIDVFRASFNAGIANISCHQTSVQQVNFAIWRCPTNLLNENRIMMKTGLAR